MTAGPPAPMLITIRGVQLLKKKRGSGNDSCDSRTRENRNRGTGTCTRTSAG